MKDNEKGYYSSLNSSGYTKNSSSNSNVEIGDSFQNFGGVSKEDNDLDNLDESTYDIIHEVAKNEFSSLKNLKNTKDLLINIDDSKLNQDKLLENVPRIYIISKNNLIVKNIKNTIKKEHYDCIGISDNIEDSLRFIEDKLPDLVFISFDLDDGSIGKNINKLDIPLIYIFSKDDNLKQNNVLLTMDYGFIFEDSDLNEIKFAMKIALKKHENNVKSVVNVKSKINEKNIELGIEKLYSALLLVLSVFLILSGIISKNVTFLQWIIFIPSVIMIFLALVSLFKMDEPTPYEVPPFVSVIIPAHNEQYTIESTVRSIANIDYNYKGKANYEVIVVNDGSEDKTGEILSNLKNEFSNLRIITRKPPKSGKGKGFVLNDALTLAHGSIIGVFDADTQVHPDFLEKLVPYLNNPKVKGVQSRVRMYNKDYNFLTNMQDVEFSGFGNILRAKDNLKFNGFLGGNGQFVKKDAIINSGKWDGFAVTEDLNLSVKILITGGEIRYCPEVAVYQEAVDNWGDFMRQRVRWAIGNFETLFVYFSSILSSKLPLFKKIGIITHISNYAFNLFIFVGFIIFIINILAWFIFHIPTVIRMEAPLLIGVISAVGFFPGIIIALLRDDKKYLKFIIDLIEYWLYCFHLIPLFFKTMWVMITRVERKWDKTTHKGMEDDDVEASQ